MPILEALVRPVCLALWAFVPVAVGDVRVLVRDFVAFCVLLGFSVAKGSWDRLVTRTPILLARPHFVAGRGGDEQCAELWRPWSTRQRAEETEG